MRMLIATDLGDDAGDQFAAAKRFHERHPGPSFVAHVMPPASRPQMLFPQESQRDVLGALEQRGLVEERLRELATGELADAEIVITEGSAGERLVELVRELAIDLVVLGGRDPGEKRFFGSVAEAVLTGAGVPVLVTRPHAATNELVAATELADDGLIPVTEALWASRPTNARVTVVHVLPRGKTNFDEAVLAPVRDALRATDTIVIEEGDPASAIVAVAERRDAELVVVASHCRKGLARMVIGSVASAVVRRAPCSVLVVPLTAASARG